MSKNNGRAVYSDYRQLVDLGFEPKVIQPCEKQHIEIEDKESDALLRMIFSVDPDTNLPVDDVGRLMSGSVDPEVVQFIKENLQRDYKSQVPLGMPVGIDEGLALDLARGDSESRTSYVHRIQNFLNTEKDTYRLQLKQIQDRAKIEDPKNEL